MRISGPRHVVVTATMGLGLLAGCGSYNTLYNAEVLYRDAEGLRLTGQDSALPERYHEVVAKANKGYESDEAGGRADDALLLIAKAQLRLGELPKADRRRSYSQRTHTPCSCRRRLSRLQRKPPWSPGVSRQNDQAPHRLAAGKAERYMTKKKNGPTLIPPGGEGRGI